MSDKINDPVPIKVHIFRGSLDWPKSLMSCFCSKTDNLSEIAIYKLYLEYFLAWTLKSTKFDYQRGCNFYKMIFFIVKYKIYKCNYIHLVH